jgi:hypothetical protein
MYMTTTHTISIPPKFWHDHRRRCVSRDVLTAKGKGGRIVVELTGDEVADLHNDAEHYSHPGDFDMTDALAMAMSARATRKAIEAQVPNLDEVITEFKRGGEDRRRVTQKPVMELSGLDRLLQQMVADARARGTMGPASDK